MTKPRQPVMIDLSAAPAAKSDPVTAPPPPEPLNDSAVVRLAGRGAKVKTRRTGVWFLTLLSGLVTLVISLWAWNYATALLAQYPVLGMVVTGIMGLLAGLMLLFALRELAALSRLRRVDRLRESFTVARTANDLAEAKRAVSTLTSFYRGHEMAAWGLSRLTERMVEQVDGTALLDLAETAVMPTMDRAALAEVESAARQVATVTAIVPLALVDVITALMVNIRMIRAIAEVYGGRAGTLGSWRLLRAVVAHLVATGALAVGDDLVGSIAGGGLISKLSRRFGEGVINGALTARIGLAAMDVCRPMPFVVKPRPKVSGVIKNALTGLFSGSN